MKYSMKNYLTFVLSLSLAFFFIKSNGQKIDYGSNNGNYMKVFDHQIYYEEYGIGTPLLLFHGGSGFIN
jgi:hypothetical protein